MTQPHSNPSSLPTFAQRVPALGEHVYQLTFGPAGHRHSYYAYSPWSPDGRFIAMLRYEPGVTAADIALLDLTNGSITTIAQTQTWRGLVGASLQWARGPEPMLVWEDHDHNGKAICATKIVDGQAGEIARFCHDMQMHMAAPSGRAVLARTSFARQFPDGAVADRQGTGLFRVDLETGQARIIVGLEQCLALHPRQDEIRDWHLFIKQVQSHNELDLIFFVFGNDAWFHVVPEENPMVKSVFVCREDGSELAYVGDIGRHPSWHATKPMIYHGTRLTEGPGTRLAAYTKNKDGWEFAEIPGFPVWSHPQIHPDLPLITGDSATSGKNGQRVIRINLSDMRSGQTQFVAENEAENATTHFALDLAKERSVASLVRSLARGHSPSDPIVMEPCPAWSPCGRWILFNGAADGVFQIYAVVIEDMQD